MNEITIISEMVQTIVAHREPLSIRAQKIYDLIKEMGGFVKAHNITFSKAVGMPSTGQADFIKYLDECIEKDFVRVMEKPGREKNGFFTFEYFCLEVLPRLREQNYEVYLVHNQYIQDKLAEVRFEK